MAANNGIYLNDIPFDTFLDYFDNRTSEDTLQPYTKLISYSKPVINETELINLMSLNANIIASTNEEISKDKYEKNKKFVIYRIYKFSDIWKIELKNEIDENYSKVNMDDDSKSDTSFLIGLKVEYELYAKNILDISSDFILKLFYIPNYEPQKDKNGNDLYIDQDGFIINTKYKDNFERHQNAVRRAFNLNPSDYTNKIEPGKIALISQYDGSEKLVYIKKYKKLEKIYNLTNEEKEQAKNIYNKYFNTIVDTVDRNGSLNLDEEFNFTIKNGIRHFEDEINTFNVVPYDDKDYVKINAVNKDIYENGKLIKLNIYNEYLQLDDKKIEVNNRTLNGDMTIYLTCNNSSNITFENPSIIKNSDEIKISFDINLEKLSSANNYEKRIGIMIQNNLGVTYNIATKSFDEIMQSSDGLLKIIKLNDFLYNITITGKSILELKEKSLYLRLKQVDDIGESVVKNNGDVKYILKHLTYQKFIIDDSIETTNLKETTTGYAYYKNQNNYYKETTFNYELVYGNGLPNNIQRFNSNELMKKTKNEGIIKKSLLSILNSNNSNLDLDIENNKSTAFLNFYNYAHSFNSFMRNNIPATINLYDRTLKNDLYLNNLVFEDSEGEISFDTPSNNSETKVYNLTDNRSLIERLSAYERYPLSEYYLKELTNKDSFSGKNDDTIEDSNINIAPQSINQYEEQELNTVKTYQEKLFDVITFYAKSNNSLMTPATYYKNKIQPKFEGKAFKASEVDNDNEKAGQHIINETSNLDEIIKNVLEGTWKLKI